MSKFVAYDISEVEKKIKVDSAKNWTKSGVVSDDQFVAIQKEYGSKLYHPQIVVRVLLFIATYLGLSSLSALFGFIFMDLDILGIRILFLFSGLVILFFVEKVTISEYKHYKSGVTEALIYSSFGLLYFGVLGEKLNEWHYLVVLFLFSLILIIRYIDVFALLISVASFVGLIFLALEEVMELIPFVVIIIFSIFYVLSQYLKKRNQSIVWETHFLVFDTLALMLIYLSGNYFVVRELSLDMMGFTLSEGEDIPFAHLFYCLTVIIPLCYMYYGVQYKSLIFIRTSLLTLALSVITLKFYFSLGHPEVTVTISGVVLLVTSLLLMKYLKSPKRGYTRGKVLSNDLGKDVTAFATSQLMGGNQINTPTEDSNQGNFGGGGASGEW